MFDKQNSDWSIAHLYLSSKHINFKPQYQRNLVWDTKTKQRLIWCIIYGQDIPKILFHIRGNGDNSVYDVIDGQQRLDAIFSFRENKIPLASNAKTIDGQRVAGLRYRQLPDSLKARFDDYTIQITSIRTDDTSRVIDQFLDLQAGRRLNGQERRLAPPGFVKDIVLELGNHPFVGRINSKRNAKYEVLSRLLVWEFNNAIVPTDSSVLDRFYLEHVHDSFEDKGWQQIYDRVKGTFDELHTMFGKQSNGLRGVIMFMLTYWLWRNVRQDYVITRDVRKGFPEWFVSFHVHIKHQEQDADAARWLRKWTGASNAAKTNVERYDHMRQFFLYAFPQLVAKDNRRHFTEEQRYLIFSRAEGRCEWQADGQICGYQFDWTDGWEPDHTISHADGGLTTVENGRVLCRYRNRANGRGTVVCPAKSTK